MHVSACNARGVQFFDLYIYKMALEFAEGKRELVIKREALNDSETAALESGQDDRLYGLSTLNYCKLTGFNNLKVLSSKIGNLTNLLQLVITNTALETLPEEISALNKLKLLDTSHSKISSVPQSLYRLSSLQTLIISNSCLDNTSFPDMPEDFTGFSNLQHIDLGQNQLSALPEFIFSTTSLLELIGSDNLLTALNENIGNLTNLKVLEMKRNQLKSIPYEFTSCVKLKTLHLEENPIEDRRLMKLITQHGAQKPKAVLDYIASHIPKPSKEKSDKEKEKGKFVQKGKSEVIDESDSGVSFQSTKPQVIISKPAELLEIKTTVGARHVRPFAVFATVHDLDLSCNENFKQFIAIQTKLHDTVCKKRRSATIATHDLSRIVPPFLFDCGPADSIAVTPLGWTKSSTVQGFLDYLEDIKPDKKASSKKKQSTNSDAALCKYLDLVNAMEMVHLKDSTGAVLSLPPLTNSELSKIEPSSTDVLLEVTSSESLATCKNVMDLLIAAMCCEHLHSSANNGLMVEQVKVVDSEGQLLVIYPARPDLNVDTIEVRRTG